MIPPRLRFLPAITSDDRSPGPPSESSSSEPSSEFNNSELEGTVAVGFRRLFWREPVFTRFLKPLPEDDIVATLLSADTFGSSGDNSWVSFDRTGSLIVVRSDSLSELGIKIRLV